MGSPRQIIRLVLVRHGSTEWNDRKLFSGWGDAPLSPKGQKEAREVGRLFAAEGFHFDEAHGSRLSRSRRTLELLLEAMGPLERIPCREFWRLNERHYGALQERPRAEVAERYGDEPTAAWRRSYRARPPELEEGDPRLLEQRERFRDVPPELLPRSESLEEGALRVEPYWNEVLEPMLRDGKRVLVVAHTSPIRGLVRILDRLDDADTEAFRIPTAMPLVYELDEDLKPLSSGFLHGNLKSRLRLISSRSKSLKNPRR